MITVRMDDISARRRLAAIAGACPRETRRALARYGGLLRRRMAKGVKGWAGAEPSELRNALHPGAAGGPLSSSRSIRIAKPSRFAIVVGWIDALAPYAARWQSGGSVGLDSTATRHALHRILGARGLRAVPVDPAGTQPPRPVVPPVSAEASREAPRVILGMVRSILRKGSAK